MKRPRRAHWIGQRSVSLAACALLHGAALAAQPVQQAEAAPRRNDPPALVTRGDLGRLALGAGLAALAHGADASVRRNMRSDAWQGRGTLGALADAGNAWGQPGVLVLGAAMWGGGAVFKHRATAAAGLRSVEAIAVSGAVTAVLKGAVGRARPRVSPDDAWDAEFGRGFRSGSGDYASMPSGHTTAAFAFAAAVTGELATRAPAHARVVGVATFGLAGATAYARMYRDAHWLSDVTMGATIGTVTGLAVARWHATRPGNAADAWLLPLVLTTPRGRTVVGVTIAWPRAVPQNVGGPVRPWTLPVR